METVDLEPYCKISKVITVMSCILVLLTLLLTAINSSFNITYIIIAQTTLLLLQIIIVVMEYIEYKKNCRKREKWEEIKRAKIIEVIVKR